MSVHRARLLDTYWRSAGLEVSEAVGRLWAVQRGNPRAACGPKGFSSGGAEEGSPRHFQCRAAVPLLWLSLTTAHMTN